MLSVEPANAVALAGWRGRIAASDAVLVHSATPDLVASCSLATASSGGMTALWLADADGLAAAMARGRPAATALASFDIVLSALGGPALRRIERDWHARRAIAFHPSADAASVNATHPRRWALGLVEPPDGATQDGFLRLFLAVAACHPTQRFVVATSATGADWPENVEPVPSPITGSATELFARMQWSLHLAAPGLRGTGFFLPPAMLTAIEAGCATICEGWPGLGASFLPGRDIVVASATSEVARVLDRRPEARDALAAAGQARVRASHLAIHRARQLDALIAEHAIARRRMLRFARR